MTRPLQLCSGRFSRHDLHGLGALIHEHALRRTARERLDAELARACEEVQNVPALDVELYDVEDGLLDDVRRRPYVHAAGSSSFLPRAVPVMTRMGHSPLSFA